MKYKAKHTRGPWNMEGLNIISNHPLESYFDIATMGSYPGYEVAAANARLIAAAPDMLKALKDSEETIKWLLGLINDFACTLPEPPMFAKRIGERNLAAIAKAEGAHSTGDNKANDS